MSYMTDRVGELEARLQDRLRDVDIALARLAAAEQLASQLSGGMGGIPGMGGGGGSYYADPGSETVGPGHSATLAVYEAAADGDRLVGDRMVINRLPDATAEDARLLLSRNRDGSYTVYQQACPEGS